jgi:hypothetical protein
MRIPIPLIFAAAVALGAVATYFLQINLVVLGSWDSRYAAFNGTHVYQTAATITTTYKTLYLGYGTAYFQNPVNVYYLQTVRSGSIGGARDLGRYLPIRVVVESGSLPTNTYITWTDPYGGATRKLYFVTGTNRGYVLGNYKSSSGSLVNVAVPVYYVVEGSQVRLYLMEKAVVSTTEACTTVTNAGLGGSSNVVIAVLDNQSYDCGRKRWSSVTVGWTSVASSVTSASLYPSPLYYKVTVTSGSNTLTLFLSYWYVVNADPGFFAVKPG